MGDVIPLGFMATLVYDNILLEKVKVNCKIVLRVCEDNNGALQLA
jgi:hypothetical protein